MLKFSLKKISLVSFIIILCASSLFAQSTKKTKGAGNKSNVDLTTQNSNESSNKEKNSVPKKRVVVVLHFDDASLTPDFKKKEMGRQMAILLSNEFAGRGDFNVIERAAIDKVIETQDKSYDSRFDPKLAAKIGKNWSAGIVVLGTITEYTITSNTLNYGFGKRKNTTAKVGLAVRLVDVNTGQVQDSVNTNGKREKNDDVIAGVGNQNELSEDLRTQMLTEAAEAACRDAVNKLVKLIDKNNQSISAKDSDSTDEKKGGFFGKVNPFKKSKNESGSSLTNSKQEQTVTEKAAVNLPVSTPGKIIVGGTGKIILKGSFTGAKVGTQLLVYRIVKEIPDPDNPKIIAFTETEDVAKIEITEIQENGIAAKIISGSGIKAGDLVKLP